MATCTPKEIAAELEVSPKVFRAFLRSPEGFGVKVGKGHRWSIERREVRSLKAKFAKWDDARRAALKARQDAADAPEVIEVDGVEVIDENEVLELEAPTDDDLLMIEAGEENDA
jgi:hypothetical protein